MKRLPPSQYLSNKDVAQRGARDQIAFILEHLEDLRRVDRYGKKEKAVLSFKAMIDNGEQLTDNMLSYVDGLYEDTWRGMGEESVEHVTRFRTLPR